MKQKKTNIELSDEDKIMFGNFMEWVNWLDKNKGQGRFDIQSNKLQTFLKDNGIKLSFKKPVPKSLRTVNKICYTVTGKSAVRSLAKHIRNAYAHSNIKKANGYFNMFDEWKKGKKQPAVVTMRGKIEENMMQGLLDAIKENWRAKNANAVGGQ